MKRDKLSIQKSAAVKPAIQHYNFPRTKV